MLQSMENFGVRLLKAGCDPACLINAECLT